MRVIAMLSMVALLGGGFVISYLVFRQMETKTVVFAAAVELERTPEGARCGDIDFLIDARTVGQWQLLIEEGQGISGVVAVEGAENLDIGLTINSPSNKLVYWGQKRQHLQQFEIDETIRGAYMFEFDNRHSALTSKSVTVSVCVA